MEHESDMDEGKTNQKLKLTKGEVTSLRCLALRKSLLDDLDLLTSATSHGRVVEVLQYVLVLAHTVRYLNKKEPGPLYLEGARQQWTNVMER